LNVDFKVATSTQRKSNIEMDMDSPRGIDMDTRRRVDLNTIISEIEKVFRTVVEDQILLRTKLDPALGLSTVDPRKIEAVLVNLIMRARDAMPPGGDLTVTTSNLDPDQTPGEIRLPPGFYVLADLSFKGSLSVPAEVRDTILQSHGEIWVHNRDGHETIVRIALPAVPRPGPLTF
jgi:signal transduction histidine kinase